MKRLLHTLQGRYIVLFLMTVLPVLGMLLAANAYMTRLTRSQLLAANEAVLGNYTAQLASTLEAMRISLADVVTMDHTFDLMQYLSDGNERTSARVAVYNRLKTRVTQYPLLDMAFAYSSYSGDFLTYEKDTLSFAQKERLRTQARTWLGESGASGRWELVQWGDTDYLVYLYHWEDAYVGGAIPAAALLEVPFAAGQDGAPAGLLCQGELVAQTPGLTALGLQFPLDGVSQYAAASTGEYMVVAAPVDGTDCTVLAATCAAEVIQAIPTYQVALLGTALFCMVLFQIVFILLRSSFVQPVQELVRVMSAVSDGDLQARVDTGKMARLQEFELIGRTFNRSVEQVQSLTGQIYEKELERQKARLHTLQMQINPHFLMNSLNIIYTASCAQKNESVQEMCTYLSRYFRYSMQTDGERVRLEEEVGFTRDYLHIQELRFEDRFEYDIHIPPFLKDALVPRMALKTFAENSIKYAVGAQRYTQLTIRARLQSAERGGRLHLILEDTGPGYPDAMLTGESPDPAPRDTAAHTGIWNMRERLRLLYGGDAQLILGRRPGGGARTELVLPLQTDKEGKNDGTSIAD